MSSSDTSPVPTRLNRSQLAVPGIRPELFEKAARSAADIIFLDLEDSGSPADKETARRNVIEGLRTLDWHGKTVSVRVNGLDTPYMYRDVIDIAEAAGDKFELMLVPKIGTASDVHAVDLRLSKIEQAKGYRRRIGLELMIETAQGLMNVEAIAGASPRAESLPQPLQKSAEECVRDAAVKFLEGEQSFAWITHLLTNFGFQKQVTVSLLLPLRHHGDGYRAEALFRWLEKADW